MATLSEIARRAGVSVSVVSRVLNGDPTVRTRLETRQRVLRVAKELNYTANFAGRACAWPAPRLSLSSPRR